MFQQVRSRVREVPGSEEYHRLPYHGDSPPAHAGVIEVQVRELAQLFEHLDPSPFHERDLNAEAEEYIVSSARELPARSPRALVLYVENPPEGLEELRAVGTAVREYFARRSFQTRRELRQLFRHGWICLCIGLTFLGGSVIGGETVARVLEASPLAVVLRESLVIGGWVAMWKPIEIFLYEWWTVWAKALTFERLSRMQVYVVLAPQTARPPHVERAGDALSFRPSVGVAGLSRIEL